MPKILSDPKENMLQEVKRLLAEEGYNAVTIRSVAQGCSVGVGTVYNYFPSKEAMLAQLLLEDWHQAITAIAACRGAQATARCIHSQLLAFVQRHESIFRAPAAAGAFAGAFSQYHSLLRSQLAAPLRPYCTGDFAADFAAEALLTWTVAGKEFCEIWELLSPTIKE